jgi:hypothetical protein
VALRAVRLTCGAADPQRRRLTDDFSGRYGDLLSGSYDRMDRIVLKACFPMSCQQGRLRCWWRRPHDGSDDQLDDTHRHSPLISKFDAGGGRYAGQGRHSGDPAEREAAPQAGHPTRQPGAHLPGGRPFPRA